MTKPISLLLNQLSELKLKISPVENMQKLMTTTAKYITTIKSNQMANHLPVENN